MNENSQSIYDDEPRQSDDDMTLRSLAASHAEQLSSNIGSKPLPDARRPNRPTCSDTQPQESQPPDTSTYKDDNMKTSTDYDPYSRPSAVIAAAMAFQIIAVVIGICGAVALWLAMT